MVGVASASGLRKELVLHVAIELAADAGGDNRGSEVAGRDFDLVRRLGNVPGVCELATFDKTIESAAWRAGRSSR